MTDFRRKHARALMALYMIFAVRLSPAPARPPVARGSLHIYRLKLNIGKAAHPTVACDGFPIARIQNGRMYTTRVSTGRHTITVGDRPKSLNVDVEAEKDYFIRIDYPANAGYAAGELPVLVPEDQGKSETKDIRPIDGWYVEAATCGRP